MKIIKQGKVKDMYPRIKRCSSCKTIFAYEKKDTIFCTINGEDLVDGVQCPICEALLTVSIFDKRYKEGGKTK